MKVCTKCHIEKEDSHFKKGRVSCNGCLSILRYCRRKGINQYDYKKSIKDHERMELERIKEVDKYIERQKVFNRMRKQNTIFCFNCENEIPCEEIAGEWHLVLGDHYLNKCNRLYGTPYSHKGCGKIVPYCWCCTLEWDRNGGDRRLLQKRKELRVQACERMGVSRSLIDSNLSLVNLKISQLFYHRKLKTHEINYANK